MASVLVGLVSVLIRVLADAWNWAVARYGDKRLFASRDILGEEDEIQSNGKLFKKLGM